MSDQCVGFACRYVATCLYAPYCSEDIKCIHGRGCSCCTLEHACAGYRASKSGKYKEGKTYYNEQPIPRPGARDLQSGSDHTSGKR